MFKTQTVSSVLPPDGSAAAAAAAAATTQTATTTTKPCVNTKSGPFTETTIHYIEEAVSRGSATDPRTLHTSRSSERSAERADDRRRQSPHLNTMANAVSTPGMYVRALYDYDADDRTSLSFRQGDIIQVITQLGSGWWDGVINGVRGWFPSNYCALVTGPIEDLDSRPNDSTEETDPELEDDEDGSGDQYPDYELDSEGNPQEDDPSPGLPMEGTGDEEQDQAAFWIPQATPDGRLFYFNTLTGVSTMELPLETPISATETGPRDRMNVNVPDQTRVPPEMRARGYDRDIDDSDYDDTNSASDAGVDSFTAGSRRGPSWRSKDSYASHGVSPATSMDSMGMPNRSRGDSNGYYNPDISISGIQASAIPAIGTTSTSFTNAHLGQPSPGALPRSFFDDGNAIPLSWNRLVEDMRLAVERYRQAINNSDRSEFVRRAEDISDHLRILLAAGSGTTDNHSGQPSIISTNKALYPHFRDMMSKFSKLVISSHIAAADWPTPDSYAKCLVEADGTLHAIYGYVEVARQQRGEDIPRLIPGFVLGTGVGGNWQNNGLSGRDPASSTFIDQDDYESFVEPTARLDAQLLERLEEFKRMITASIRRLDEQVVITDKIITPPRHEAVSDAVCSAGARVLDVFKSFVATIESVNLSPLASQFQSQALTDFAMHKQRLYDTISDLLISCQAVASPLGDEWSEGRGEPLENRLHSVRSTSRSLETATSQIYQSLQGLMQMMPKDVSPPPSELDRSDAGAGYSSHQRSDSLGPRLQRPPMTGFGPSDTSIDLLDPMKEKPWPGNSSKVSRILGEVPGPVSTRPRDSDDIPDFLRLDFENEIAFDTKTDPPQLRGGTLMALVEQLTRHDKLDSPFNNTFLLTYRSFTTANELFDMLVRRFCIQPPPGISPDDCRVWADRKQKPIRFRVVNILKSWFDTYWMEGQDAASKDLIRRVHDFAEKAVATSRTPGAKPLMTILEQRLRGQETNAKRLVLTLNTTAPVPILPKNMKKLKFLDIDVTEFARQLTVIESRLYGKIKPTECLNKTWQKKVAAGEAEPAANVKALILHSNQLTNWVAEMILTQTDLKKRVVVIKHFVSVAEKCRNLNNFCTLTSIISALGTAPIHRLQRTWHQVHARTMTSLEQMRTLMSSTKNFAEYRETLHLANPPCIPFFGVYLTDLTFIEDGIPSIIKKTSLINFAKRAKTAEVIRDIQQYQNVPYPLQPVPELQDYILTNMQAAGDVHEMYDRSLAVEPRENQDEKIAR
ncbi:MAG: hypothetical protein M1817_005595 [Caeruleum heppii]|nr:MAG: hypothetical protein M1817_005595 [Caeruleum heppii]